MSDMAELVPPDFEIPLGIATSEFVLEPLGPEHNDSDYAAWTSSIVPSSSSRSSIRSSGSSTATGSPAQKSSPWATAWPM